MDKPLPPMVREFAHVFRGMILVVVQEPPHIAINRIVEHFLGFRR